MILSLWNRRAAALVILFLVAQSEMEMATRVEHLRMLNTELLVF
jgi:hypothetical protein